MPKSASEKSDQDFGAMALGHQGQAKLPKALEERLKDFQTNLLSMLSHEFRTPLMGVLNAVTMAQHNLGEPTAGPFGVSQELLTSLEMAEKNALRLNRTLNTFLDLASIDQNAFGVRLGEAKLEKLIEPTLKAFQSKFSNLIQLRQSPTQLCSQPEVLLDSKRFEQWLTIWVEIFLAALSGPLQGRDEQRKDGEPQENSMLEIHWSLRPLELELSFIIKSERDFSSFFSGLKAAIDHARLALAGGTTKSTSLFYQATQGQQDFLATGELGVGSEAVIAFEILRLHQIQESLELDPGKKQLSIYLKFPLIQGLAKIRTVLESRLHLGKQEVSSLALFWIEIGFKTSHAPLVIIQKIKEALRSALFRGSDSLYEVTASETSVQVVLMLNDCRKKDQPTVLGRIKNALVALGLGPIKKGQAFFPDDALGADELLELAQNSKSTL